MELLCKPTKSHLVQALGTSLRPIQNRLLGLLLNCPKKSKQLLLMYVYPMTGRKKDYFPNNWQEYKDADDANFIPHTFEEIMSWKVAGWELPSSVCCIIRVNDLKSGKVNELVYQKRSAAQNKVNQLLSTPDVEFTVVDHESIHHLSPATLDDIEDL